MPLAPLSFPLEGGAILLRPLERGDAQALQELAGDPEVVAFTPAPPPSGRFVMEWIESHRRGWRDGTRAGFSIRDRASDAFIGFAGLVRLDLAARQGEVSFVVSPGARGSEVALGALNLLTRWGFDELGLRRLEMRIHCENHPALRVAGRAGYQREGVLRSLHFKEGVRSNFVICSLLENFRKVEAEASRPASGAPRSPRRGSDRRAVRTP